MFPLSRVIALTSLTLTLTLTAAARAEQTESDAQMASMDAYFACAFAEMRESRSKNDSATAYKQALQRACGSAELELRKRSAALARAQGLHIGAAAAKAQSAIDDARAQLITMYGK